jgi:PIN domain nuclease of toxin-antitoxin system
LPNSGEHGLVVFDSSAILAVLLSERGADVVLPVLQGGLLSSVNFIEIYTRVITAGAAPVHAWNSILSLQCEICPLTETQARIAAELVAVTRPFGLSLGDRACLALAIERDAKIYTTDRIWKTIPLGIEVELIR